MKHFDDEKILSSVQRNENYQIQSTSEEILKRYYLQKGEASLPNKNKKVWQISFGFVGAALLATSIFLTVFLIPKSEKKIPYLPSESRTFLEELSSFSFYQGKKENSIQRRGKNNFLSTNQEIEDPLFNAAVTSFDTQFDFFSSCFHFQEGKLHIENLALETPYVLLENSYPYRSDFSYEDAPLFQVYYGDLDVLSKKENASFEVVYFLGGKTYQVEVKKTLEEEKDEVEEELSLTFMEVNGEDIFRIEKEKETEEGETEHSYSIKSYASREALKEDEPYLSVSFELEEEENAQESSFEIEYQDAEYSFENITCKENIYSFDLEAKKETEKEYRGASLEITNVNRIYRYQTLEVIFRK